MKKTLGSLTDKKETNNIHGRNRLNIKYYGKGAPLHHPHQVRLQASHRSVKLMKVILSHRSVKLMKSSWGISSNYILSTCSYYTNHEHNVIDFY